LNSVDKSCPFCDRSDDVMSNNLAYARYDKYPVTDGHILVVPHRHVGDYFELTIEEKLAIVELLEEVKCLLDREKNPDGYNIGINVGEAAGQTVMHAHIHLIPRYDGDMDNPRGGVRGVIPDRQNY
jgi:diadenosine tetraphosphate (Ap4A) HIT family hydrolase